MMMIESTLISYLDLVDSATGITQEFNLACYELVQHRNSVIYRIHHFLPERSQRAPYNILIGH